MMAPGRFFSRNPGFGATDMGSIIGKEGMTGSYTFGEFISLKGRGERGTLVTTIHHVVRPSSLKLKATNDLVNEFRHGSTETASKIFSSSSWTSRRRHRSSMKKRKIPIYQKYQGQGKRFTMKRQNVPETLSH